MSNLFIKLEDEITLRMSIRAVWKHEGIQGIYQVLGELAESMAIVSQVAEEILDDEKKKNEGGK